MPSIPSLTARPGTVKTGDVDFSQLANFTPRQKVAEDLLESGLKKFVLYGGALGGGKSYWLRWVSAKRHMLLASWGYPKTESMLACEDYPSLKDRQIGKIDKEFPQWLGKMHSDHRLHSRCFILHERWGGGVICFRNLDDPSKYASAEFAFIGVDELTKNSYDVFTHLKTRIRWPGLPDIEAPFFAGTNPGSVGHGWVKQLWMDKLFAEEWIHPIDYRPYFAYVPSKATDNPHLHSSYWDSLNTLPINIRKAFRDGDWDVFLGQAFPEFSKEIHVIEPLPVPKTAPLYMTFDWGFGKPFSVGWWWVDGENRIYRFNEWYGFNGTANQGIRIPDTDIARGILKRERKMGIYGRPIIRLTGHDSFSKKPDYKGGGQGESTEATFSKHKLYLTKADSDRKLKIRAFRERLIFMEEEVKRITPMMLIYNHCVQFIRTIKDLTMDERSIEDINTDGEDHAYDEAAMICMDRPISMKDVEEHLDPYQKRILALERGVGRYNDDEDQNIETIFHAGGGYRHLSSDDFDDLYNDGLQSPEEGLYEQPTGGKKHGPDDSELIPTVN